MPLGWREGLVFGVSRHRWAGLIFPAEYCFWAVVSGFPQMETWFKIFHEEGSSVVSGFHTLISMQDDGTGNRLEGSV